MRFLLIRIMTFGRDDTHWWSNRSILHEKNKKTLRNNFNENFYSFNFFLNFRTGTDEVEKSLELLDKVLLEFEEQENRAAGEPESPSQGHQSEDDGYMSMNGRR